MYLTVPIAMFGWPFMVLALIALLPSRRAMLASFLIGWLFLPMANYKFPGFPDYSKVTATVLGVVLGTAFFDPDRILRLRPKWMDMPMMVWCLCPLASSVHNNLGIYDGLSAAFNQTLVWGIPYLIGRAYLADFEGLRDLVLTILIGGLIYIPLCLFEIRFSPQLHHWIYGFSQAPFHNTKRYGGYRPLVFMQSGLAVGLWMVDASTIAIWFWFTGAVRHIFNISIGAAAAAQVATAVLCKSTGALVVLVIGLGVLFISRRWKSALPLFCLVAIIPGYIALRLDNMVSPDTVGSVLSHVFDANRVQSFLYRMDNEQLLSAKALRQPIWGWGGWNRSEIKNTQGKVTTVTDSLWIIALGHNGFTGLISLFLSMLLPATIAWYQYPPRRTSDIRIVSLHLASLLQVSFAIDCLLNAMVNPMYVLAMGGVTSILLQPLPRTMTVNSSGVEDHRPTSPFRPPAAKTNQA